MSIFEIIMVASFGAAWPASIWKSIKSRATKGKSVQFLLIIEIGYIAGMLHKIFYNFDPVFFLYLLNFIMVAVDTALFLRNKKYEKLAELSASGEQDKAGN